MRSCSSLVLVNQSTKEVAAAHPGSARVADPGRTGGGIGRFQPKRSVWTVLVVVLDIDPEDLLEVTAADDQQPVEALDADGPHPSLRVGVGVGGLHWRQDHLGVLRAEHVVEGTAELRVTIADEEAHAASLVLQAQQEVAGLLGDPGGVGIGGHPGQVHAPGVEFDEEQHIQPPQPDGVDGEAGRRRRSRRPAGAGTPAKWWPSAVASGPGRGGAAWCGSRSPTPVRRAAGVHPGGAGSPNGVLCAQADDQLLQLLVQWWSPWSAVRVVQALATRRRCQRSSVSGLTRKHDQRERGRVRLSAASGARSAGWSLGRDTCRRSTASWWRSTRISRSLAVSPRASRTSSWMQRQSVREASFDSTQVASEPAQRRRHPTARWLSE